MKTRIGMLLAGLLLAGCSVNTLEHSIYSPTTGKIVEHYKVAVVRNAYDTKADSASLKLPDGTTLDLHQPSSNPNANVVAATQAISTTLVQAIVDALKVVGIP